MKKSAFLRLPLLALLLVACQPAATPTAEPEPTDVPIVAATDTAQPTASATMAPTASPEPTLVPPTEITYVAIHGGRPHADWETSQVDDFIAANPDIAVDLKKLNMYSRPVPNTIDSRMNFDPAPDVVSGFMAGAFLDFVEAGQVADISDLWEANGWYELFPQSVIDMASVDDKQYFVPTMAQWHPIFFRADIFERHDLTPPESWDELLGVCDTLSSAGQVPFTVSIAGWSPPAARWFTYLNLRVNGPEFHAELMRGRESYQDDRVRAVFAHWQILFDHNCFAHDAVHTGYGTAAAAWQDGDAAMYLLGEWLSESWPEGFDDNTDFFAFPIIDPEVPNGEIGHHYGAFMHADAPNPDLARRLLTHLGSLEAQQSFVDSVGRISMHSDVDISALGPMYTRGQAMLANAGFLTSLYELGTHEAMASIGLSGFVDFWHNPGNIETYLATMEARREREYGPLP
jgi:multiple sugar transport system substrate-binding protein/raffinose/stachyose/melibiose transport system substrate-binding protein